MSPIVTGPVSSMRCSGLRLLKDVHFSMAQGPARMLRPASDPLLL